MKWKIFSNLFLSDSKLYISIIESLVQGPKSPKQIAEAMKIEYSAMVINYCEELKLAGHTKRDYTWNLKEGLDSKLSHYRLSDNYLRFYLNTIRKRRAQIDRGRFELACISSIPEWSTIIGLQFENLVLNNRKHIHDMCHILPEDIVNENPFFQNSTQSQKGCQIDYLIQARHQCLYVCEIKFSKNPIGIGIIDGVQQKMDRLKRPKGFSCRAVLIHVNGVTESVEDSDYFYRIIDFSQVLNG